MRSISIELEKRKPSCISLLKIIAGVLAAKFGSKIMLFIGMFFGSLMTLLVPVAANTHHVALFVVRLLNGVANAFFMPGMSSLW